MSALPDTAAPTGRTKPASRRRGKDPATAGDTAQSHTSQNTLSPDGAKEAGELPKGWRWVTLGDVTESMKNGIYKPASSYADDGLACLRMYNIGDGKIVWRDIKRMRLSEAEIQEYEILPGDLLVNRVNSRELVGKSVAIPTGLERCVFESKNIRVRIRRDLASPEFVSYRLFFAGSRYFTQNAQQVVGMASISQPQVARFPLPLPPLPEQRRIVAEIEKQFTRLDAGVAALRRVQAHLKRYRAAVLKAACEGKLVPTEAELQKSGSGVPPLSSAKKRQDATSTFESGSTLLARILTERRQNWQGRGKYKEPDAPDTTKLSPLPDGWAWASAEQLTLLVTSGSRGWGEFYSDAGPLFIRAQDIKTDSLKLDGVARVTLPAKAEGLRSSVENRDLLITITGANVTKSAIVRGLSEVAFVSQHVALLKPVCREAAAFQFLCIVSPAHGRKTLEKWAYGAGKPGLSLEQVRNLPIPPQRCLSSFTGKLSLQCGSGSGRPSSAERG